MLDVEIERLRSEVQATEMTCERVQALTEGLVPGREAEFTHWLTGTIPVAVRGLHRDDNPFVKRRVHVTGAVHPYPDDRRHESPSLPASAAV